METQEERIKALRAQVKEAEKELLESVGPENREMVQEMFDAYDKRLAERKKIAYAQGFALGAMVVREILKERAAAEKHDDE